MCILDFYGLGQEYFWQACTDAGLTIHMLPFGIYVSPILMGALIWKAQVSLFWSDSG